MLGMFGIKAAMACGLALALSAGAAYAIHIVKASGSMETALEVTQKELEAREAARLAERAHVERLAKANANLLDAAENRSKALREALAAMPAEKATTTCPVNCFLR